MFRIIDLQSIEIWRSCWNQLPAAQRSVYLSPDYYLIYESVGQGKAYCCLYETADGLFLFPFLKREIPKSPNHSKHQYYDIEGAYGLNGVGCFGLNDEDIKCLSTIWCTYCSNENIIAEFSRLNPLLNTRSSQPYLHVQSVSQVISVDLHCADLLYESYEHSVRKAINKANRLGVQIEIYGSADLPDIYLQEFLSVYTTTMDRNSAAQYYYFSSQYFQLIKNNLQENATWFFAILDGKIISVELVLHDECFCYSFLGGTLAEYLSTGANVLLKHGVITFFKEKGLASYFLGGGSANGDGIYKYKKSFAKNSHCDFFIGKKIHIADAYETAVKNWELLNPEKIETYKNYFLKYRY